jgi:hypothetical protein
VQEIRRACRVARTTSGPVGLRLLRLYPGHGYFELTRPEPDPSAAIESPRLVFHSHLSSSAQIIRPREFILFTDV